MVPPIDNSMSKGIDVSIPVPTVGHEGIPIAIFTLPPRYDFCGDDCLRWPSQ